MKDFDFDQDGKLKVDEEQVWNLATSALIARHMDEFHEIQVKCRQVLQGEFEAWKKANNVSVLREKKAQNDS